ncbi:Mor transcription activator family protein [Desulfovibrio psychrotolerans]|uniref:Mor transcription activator domain-containing protein n=1 Tax=Desulfovibrio psychrotolerans TaxID=415242 RepID=A0A7J0BVL7_9BACT|nr:Mor transcription activator family protein [Desulfovibrio psychrotolerans]GFM37713.1 hypothetical protein DSM19430T_23970 [Desulfovibrio psychrotolerans]
MSSSERGCELLKDVQITVQATVEQELRIRGMVDMSGLPENLGRVVSSRLAEEWGGQLVYIPMNIGRRNARIYDQFTGDNVHDLAKKFRLSVQRVYKIIADERARRRMPQLNLPLD